MKRRFISGLLAGMMAVSLLAGLPEPVKVSAKTVSGLENANFNFEEGITGWETTGTVTEETSGAQGGSKYVHLEAGASITTTIKDISQGSYTLSAWVKGTAGKNAKLTVSETGGPDSVALLDAYKNADAWTEMGHRNVLVYNGQMTITIEAGDKALDLDTMELVMDSADENTLSNWGFEEGQSGWTTSGNVEAASGNDADTGDKALRLGADSEISQKISVEPNTRYSVTMRARVDKQDTFQTEKVKSTYRTDSAGNLGTIGENETRTELGDRVNLGVRSTDGTVLRQAPAGTEGYGLVTITFETGADQTEVEVYANTKYDQAYKDSVTVYTSAGEKLADDWQGNGSDYAYVDNFDVFRIQDENYLRGADVSFLPAVEDLDGKYFANGVQQDCLRILSNHGVNSITNMLFVHAGKSAHYTDSLATVYLNEAWGGLWIDEQGNPLELKMIAPEDEAEAWFGKEHSLALGKRATALGMSYLPSFHYSDTWMSNAKAYTPEEWLDTDYENTYKNTDLSHMQSIVYNYVYDFMKSLKDNNVNVCGVKHGNEQNGGIVWPVGKGATSQGHAKLIAASYAAAEDAMPGVAAYVHTNNGYDSNQMKTFFKGLLKNGAEFDGMAFSLYGGRSSGNIISMANAIAADETLRYMDYVNVETAFSFTKYQATMDTATSSMGQPAYYNTSANGQYNWLLDYMQAALDTPNAYGQTRGFYYWEVDELPTPGIGSSAGVSGDISCRIMFNNGDTGIREMGSTKDGKVGDMMDSMYAYLMRGCPKNKSKDMITPLKDAGTYSVDVTDPTGITLSKDSITLAVGEQERLQPTVTPVDQVLSDSNITYTSSDPSVAKVTQDGFVYGVSAGDAKITASVKGGNEAAVDVKITEAGKAEGLTLKMDGKEVTDSSTHSAAVLDKVQLTSVLSGSNVTDQTVIYTSSDAEVASFLGETWQQEEKGSMRQETEKTDTAVQLNVKAVGSTVITAQTADGSKKVSFMLNVSKVDITSVTLDKTEAEIGFGRTLQLKVSITPENTTKYKIHWKSENTSVATVDENGLVNTVGVGDAVIKAISDDNEDVYGSCTVHVLPVQVESIALSKTSLTLQTGSSKKIDTIITPSNADNKEVTWESSDDSIAKVDENGNVTGVAEGGPVIVTATTKNGGYQASCKVTVQKDAIPVSSVTLDQENYYFISDYFSDKNAFENAPVIRMEATVLPDTATNTDVTWESDTPGVATVDAYGQVTAVAAGVTTITAKTADGGYVAAAKVYVPAVSESFDNREAGDTWDMGKSVTLGTLTAAVAEDSDGNAFLQMTGGGSGDRALMKKFQKAVRSDEVIVDFDWNVGKVSSGPAYLTVTDSSSHCYFGLQTNSKGVLSYGSRGTMEMGGELSDTQEFGTAFNKTNTWYHVHAVIDMTDEKTTLTLTSKADESVTATKEIAFVSGISYTKDVAAVHFYGRRNGGSLS